MNRDRLLINLVDLIDFESAGLPRAFIVGITGPDASGKTTFAAEIVDSLSDKGRLVQPVHVDDFHRPRAERYAGDAPEHVKYLTQSFDLTALVDNILVPARSAAGLHRGFTHLNVATDEWSEYREYQIDQNTVVVVEGVLLLLPQVRPLLDLIVHLDVDEQVAMARGVPRDLSLYPDARRRYQQKYLPAQREVFAANPPHQCAHIVIDNTSLTSPRVMRWCPR